MGLAPFLWVQSLNHLNLWYKLAIYIYIDLFYLSKGYRLVVSSPFFTYQYYWLPIIPFSDFNMFFNMLKRHGTPPAGTPRCGFFVPCSGWDCDRAPFAVLWSTCRQPENGNVTNGTALRIAGHLEKKLRKRHHLILLGGFIPSEKY